MSASARLQGRELAARLRPLVLPGAAYLLAAVFIGANTLRIGDWAVMTDELLYSKLAIAIAETGSPVPTVHGEYYAALGQLYPLLLAPLYLFFDVPTAFRVAHGFNAALMASAALPTFLLARTLVPRGAAAVVGFASVVTPWALIAGFLMTEAAAYPAFAWAALAMHRSVARPSRRADVLVLVALAVAFFARTQFVVLAVVLPLAVVAHEAGFAAFSGRGRAAVREALRRAADGHRVLLLAYGTAAAALVAAAAVGALGELLGTYSVTATEGSLLPSGVWSSAVAHFVAVAIGVGVLPFLLAGGWAVATLVRPSGRDAHAVAVLTILTAAALSLQVASYDLRFGETDLVRDRYVFYVVPLMFVSAAAALFDRRPSAVLIGAATVVFALGAYTYEFQVITPFTVDSPVGLANQRLDDWAGELSTATFVAVAAGLLAIAFVAARSLARPATAAWAALVVMAAVGALATQDAFAHVHDSTGPSGRVLTETSGEAAGWIDDALPDGADVAIVPSVAESWEASAVRWWDVEFWNRSIDEAYVDAGGRSSFTPFAVRTLTVDWTSGRVRAEGDAPAFLVIATRDVRFRLAGPRRRARGGAELIAAERPYRVEWASRGIDVDGWVRSGRRATFRAFGRPGGADEVVSLQLVLKAPVENAARYRIATGGGSREGSAAPDAAVVERLDLCIPAAGLADVTVAAAHAARIALPALGRPVRGTRDVGVRIEGVLLERPGTPCTAGTAG